MKKLMFFVACCVIAGIMNVNALTSVQQESIKKFTINFVEEGLSKKDSNGYPIFAYMQGQARIIGYKENLYYMKKDYLGINNINGSKWTFDCASFVSYIYKNVFGLNLVRSDIDSMFGSSAEPYLVKDFVKDADLNKKFIYVNGLRGVTASTIDYSKMQPGDLIVIKGSHIMIYIGDKQFAHATSSAITSDKKLGIEFNTLQNKYPNKKVYVIRVKNGVISSSNTGNMKVTWPDDKTTSDYSSVDINVDVNVNDKPSINATLSTKEWAKKMTINMSFSDKDGLRGYSVSKSSVANYINISGNNVNKTYEVNENGTYYIKVIDVKGNVSSKTIEINNIDTSAPIINSFVYQNGYLIVNASDSGSGLNGLAYSFDNGTWTSVNKKKISKNGTYSVRVRDKLGNIVTKTINVTNYAVDSDDDSNIYPSISVKLSTNKKTKTVTVYMSFTDKSGLAGYCISTSKTSNYIKINGKSVNKTYTVRANGTYYINVININGNVSTKTITINNISSSIGGSYSNILGSSTINNNNIKSNNIKVNDNNYNNGFSSFISKSIESIKRMFS